MLYYAALCHAVQTTVSRLSDGVLVLCHDANFRRLALGGSAYLVQQARGLGWVKMASCAIYGLSLIACYGASTLYHSFFLLPPRQRRPPPHRPTCSQRSPRRSAVVLRSSAHLPKKGVAARSS